MLKDSNNRRKGSTAADAKTADDEYKVGPGRPPREYQFKPGQSGNPKGARRKQPAIALDLKAALEQALNKKVRLKQGDKERLVTMAIAGMEQMVAQFAEGDRHARRDLIALADKLGVDLLAGQNQVIQDALAANHEVILRTYVERQSDKVVTPSPVLAPPELLDDDPEEPKKD